VHLGKRDRQQIAGMLSRGREPVGVLGRAMILRQLDQGLMIRPRPLAWVCNWPSVGILLGQALTAEHADARSNGRLKRK
jgi:hypothetical protein